MIVLGHRVLVRPDAQPEHEGAILLPQDRDFVATSGEILQIGAGGSAWRFHARQKALASISHLLSAELDMRHATAYEAGLRRAVELVTAQLGTAEPECDLKVGDRVAFGADHGVAVTVGGEPHLVLNHDDVVVIVAESEAA